MKVHVFKLDSGKDKNENNGTFLLADQVTFVVDRLHCHTLTAH